VDDPVTAAPVADVAPTCASCGTPAAPGARFCEECGSPLPASVVATAPHAPPTSAPTRPIRAVDAEVAQPEQRACVECGGEVGADGYCTVCGAKAPLPRDHMVEQPQPWVAAVSDRGLRHHRNEDAAATAADPAPGRWAALVVCDGVSSSASSDVASLAAARAACDLLVRERGAGLASGSALTTLAAARMVAATAVAATAVADVTRSEHGDSPPSCTFVAAVLEGGSVTVGTVGDSRAYWLPDVGEPRALTTDDSWAAQQVAAGLPRSEAEAGPQAHAITRWLGIDAEDQAPTVTHHPLDGDGWLLLCSDGLWNYASEATAIAQVAARAAAGAGGDPLPMAVALVGWANEQGGTDNITVALARIGARTHEGDPA
jgi:serine/threonine protein phosphatase PrpC